MSRLFISCLLIGSVAARVSLHWSAHPTFVLDVDPTSKAVMISNRKGWFNGNEFFSMAHNAQGHGVIMWGVGHCLQASAVSNGAPIHVDICDSTKWNQRWKFEKTKYGVKIVTALKPGGKAFCFNVKNAPDGATNGQRTEVWECNNDQLQSFTGVEPKLPKGLIFENATEIEQELKRNAQFEQEWKEGNYISALSVAHGITNCNQECDEWCWATSATMCASAFGASGSCDRNEEKVASHRQGSQCDSRCSGACDRAGSPGDIVSGIQFLSGHAYTVGGVLSQSQLDDALRNGPVVMLVQWNGGGGHAVTLSGGSGGYYTGHDPEGYPINTHYGGLTSYHPPYGGRGRWAQSVYTSGSSPRPSPAPSPGPSPSGCSDTPQNWISIEGDSCNVYVSNQYCTPSGQEGPGWNHNSWGPIAQYTDRQGRAVVDACCGCGGGDRRSVIV